jgi:exosortase
MPLASSSSTRPTVSSDWTVWALLAALCLSLAWAYWSTAAGLYREWQNDPNYSVGQLVPLAALYLLWNDRECLARCSVAPYWWGIGVVLVALAGRLFGLVWLYESAERYAMVLTIVGLALLIGGRQVFRSVFWILAFLFLMVPLPGRIHLLISGPLQQTATSGAVFGLELLGIMVGRQGNQILLNQEVPINIAEECSGLRMLTAFIVVAATLAYVVQRPRWQKVVLVCSSIPIAILCNIVRLIVTAFLFLNLRSELAERFFHDFAGVTMMPLAVLLLLAELWIMSKLVVPEEQRRE